MVTFPRKTEQEGLKMDRFDPNGCFQAQLHSPASPTGSEPWSFILLPKEASDLLPRRGRTTVEGTLNGIPFQSTLEPDGQLGHWLKVTEELLAAVGVPPKGTVQVRLRPVEVEPEPDIPDDFRRALALSQAATEIWNQTTTLARLDWIHWITSAKQQKTRLKRIADACSMLGEGHKRVCCFDNSGFYSKAFKVPTAKSLD